ncbi:UNVERIFIED_ORG: hypothetical protein QOE_3205 [Clostridioides difficile F501]
MALRTEGCSKAQRRFSLPSQYKEKRTYVLVLTLFSLLFNEYA